MENIELTEDNIEEYSNIIDEDIAENLGRDSFRGIALHEDIDDPACAALIWELKNLDEEADNEAELMFFYADCEENGEELIKRAEESFGEDEVKKTYFELPEYSDNAEESLDNAGYSPKHTESRDIVVTVGELAALEIAKKDAPEYIAPIESLMVRQFKKGIANCMFHGKKGIMEDLATLPMSWYEPDISCCVQTDGKVTGYILVHKMPSGKLIVNLLCAIGPDFRMDLIHMIRFSIRAAAENYPADTEVILRRHNDASKGLSARLFPKKTGESVIAGMKEGR